MPFNLGLGLGIQRGGYMFSPASQFAASEPGVIYDASDLTTLFQDTAGTQPVTAVGQAVALVLDKSGRGNHATQSILASRPLYALHPSSGIRNLANGSADVGNAAYWATTTTTNGVTVARVAQGIDTDGLPFTDYSVSGTASADTTSPAYLSGMSRVAGTSGQTFTSSFIARVISGTPPPVNNGVRADVVGETAPATLIEATISTVVAPTVDTVITASRTLNNASTNQARGLVSILTRPGVTVNYTIRIKAVQFELGSARTAYQFNYAITNIVEAPFAQVGNLLFDGVDDFLVTPTITPGTDKVQVFAGVRKQSDAAFGAVAELGTLGANGTLGLAAPAGAAANYSFAAQGTVFSFATSASSFAAPDTAVLTGTDDIAGDSVILRRNGSQIASSTADQGTGNYSAAPIYIGRRGGTSLPFNGRLYGLVVRFGPNLDAATIAATESWMNTRTGAY